MVGVESNAGCRAAVRRGPGAAARLGAGWRIVVTIMGAVAAIGQVPAAEFTGEDPLPLRDVIGAGIHAYHAGDFHRAYEDFTQAIEAGTHDPRGYYFRGLAALKMGRTSEAQADFTTAADRELETGGTRRISQSLERVQGPDRLTLERYRARARLGSLQREREAYDRRYSAIDDAAGDVRRRRRPEDIRPELVAPGGPASGPAAAAIEEVPPPAAKPSKPATKPAPKSAETIEDEPATDGDDPFADEPTDGADASEDEQAERGAQDEEMDAEVEDAEAEAEVQAEVDAASGQ